MTLFIRTFLKCHNLFIAGLMLISSCALSQNSMSQASTRTVEKLYHILNNNSKYGMAERLDVISAYFSGKPYILGALGEGPTGRYDQSPLYRFDGFDCETYVDTVLAIALANSVESFKACINKIRYHNAEVDYLSRNHFTSLDWNLNNQKQGLTKDITLSIKNAKQLPVAKIATALIDKPSWYQHANANRIKLIDGNRETKADRLAELRSKGKTLSVAKSKIAYLPLDALFDAKGKPDETLFTQIPDASIIEIVRPNWDLQKQIGTHLNVSHLGFAFWKGKTLVFRQASSQEKSVIDVPLAAYLLEARKSPTIKGINVQIVVPAHPIQCGE